ncbi:hypothetical protein [Tabrizicola sp.]|uniref:hypothetical protein n=1 Tax=Tabrizicola sp. TaxID=2005166 RepID=UPI0035AD9B08
MACNDGKCIVADSGMHPDTQLTENEWRWIEILRIICDNQVPAPNFPAGMSMKEFFGGTKEDGH